MDLLKILGTNIRQFRKARELTQAQLAENINLSVEMIGKIERGIAAPSLNTIEKIVKELQVPPGALFGARLEDMPMGSRAELIYRIQEKLADMNEADLGRICKMIEAF